jgi:hypothetical protein
MRAALDAGDLRILIAAGAVLLALAAASFLTAPPARDPFVLPCSHSAGPGGAKAVYLLLGDLGYRVERWQSPPALLPDEAEGTVLVLAGPLMPGTPGAIEAVRAFVDRGGRVVVAGVAGAALIPGGAAGPATPGVAGPATPAGDRRRIHRPLVPSPLARHAPEIAMAPAGRWTADHGEHLAVYGDGVDLAVVIARRGVGAFLWWAAPTPLTNAGVSERGNLALLLNALGPPEGTRVLWDEYTHGHRGTLWAYLEGTPVPWGLLQAAILVAALCFTFARRSGPVRPPAAEPRLSPLEFVDTMGALYRRARAAPAAVEDAARRFRVLLGRRLRLPPSASDERLCAAARERLGADERLLETLRACAPAIFGRGPRLGEAEALRLVQALHDHAGALRLGEAPARRIR